MPPSRSKKTQSKSSTPRKPTSSRPKAGVATAGAKAKALPLGQTLRLEALTGLTAELTSLRQHPPVVQRAPGKYEGDILGFVRGLRFSARVLYFLRDHLSEDHFQVCWGHLLSENDESCSPECDIIVHNEGLIRKWNGTEDPVMNFSFVKASAARAVVSCKSVLTSIDAKYPKDLRKHGVKHVFLFAETCKTSQLESLRKKARIAGYAGFCCLYTTETGSAALTTNEPMWLEFGQALIAAANRARDRATARELKNQQRAAAKKAVAVRTTPLKGVASRPLSAAMKTAMRSTKTRPRKNVKHASRKHTPVP